MKIHFESDNKYNPDHVLQRISDVRIIEHFFNQSIERGKAYKCCFHKERTASLHFRRLHDGTLIYNCFGCGSKGTALNFVQNIKKISYHEAVKLVVDTLEGVTPSKVEYNTLEYKKDYTNIVVYKRDFNNFDLSVWNNFGITKKTLIKFNVFPISLGFILKDDKSIKLEYKDYNPLYCYNFGNNKYKLYFPLNKSKNSKFFSNCDNTVLQGYTQLPKNGELLIITSSLKDVMLLHEMGYNAIAPNSEVASISEEQISELKSRFNRILIFYDSDNAGFMAAEKLKEKFDINNIFIPLEYNSKDITDFYKNNDQDKTKFLLDKLVNG